MRATYQSAWVLGIYHHRSHSLVGYKNKLIGNLITM